MADGVKVKLSTYRNTVNINEFLKSS